MIRARSSSNEQPTGDFVRMAETTSMAIHSFSRMAALAARPHLALLLVVLLGGCATAGSYESATSGHSSFDASAIGHAALDAAKNPRVWVPLVAAAGFQINGLDRKVSDWAREETPVFGSQSAAADWSDRLNMASTAAYLVSTFSPTGSSEEWQPNTAMKLGVGLGAIATTAVMTDVLKSTTGRTRPNGSSTSSFPSGHTSYSTVVTGLARANIEDADLNNGTRHAMNLGLDALAVGTAWARVEAGAHFGELAIRRIHVGVGRTRLNEVHR
jgi:hypothetical protein